MQPGQPEKLLAAQGVKPAPLQAIPALAKIQTPSAFQYRSQFANVQIQGVQPYLLNSYSQNTVLTPYSASFVQIYQ